MVFTTGTLDASTGDVSGDELDLTTETTLTLYTFSKTGNHNTHEIGIEISPDGALWMALRGSTHGNTPLMPPPVAALKARPYIVKGEGKASEIIYYLLAN